MSFDFAIPKIQPENNLMHFTTLQECGSFTFVGANGSGKTRLGFFLEHVIEANTVFITAHRALNFDLSATPSHYRSELSILHESKGIREESDNSEENEKISSSEPATLESFINPDHDPAVAKRELRANETVSGWNEISPSKLVDDFKQLNQTLYSELNNVAIPHYYNQKNSKLKQLVKNWNEIFSPNKVMEFDDEMLDLVVTSTETGDKYKPSELSDGERAIFYIIGQVLLAEDNSVIIIDEPELHMHKSIMTSLWSKLTKLNKSCKFIFLTHDLQFAAARGGQKFIIKNFSNKPAWEIEKICKVPEFSEEVYLQILGSKEPIIFCEGNYDGKDYAVYQACFPDCTVIPRQGCKSVINSVTVMKNNPTPTHLKCIGIIDRDFRSCEEVDKLTKKDVLVLPVLEIENLFLIPEIFEKIANSIKYSGNSKNPKSDIKKEIINYIKKQNRVDESLVRFAYDKLEQAYKNDGLCFDIVTDMFNESLHKTSDNKRSVTETLVSIKKIYNENIKNIDLCEITKKRKSKFDKALLKGGEDIVTLLQLYDDKQLLNNMLRKVLKNWDKTKFKEWLREVMKNNTQPELTTTIKSNLKEIETKLNLLNPSRQEKNA